MILLERESIHFHIGENKCIGQDQSQNIFSSFSTIQTSWSSLTLAHMRT